MGLICEEGEQDILDKVRTYALANYDIQLVTVPVTPVLTDNFLTYLPNLATSITFPGYTEITLNKWGPIYNDSSTNAAYMIHPPVTWVTNAAPPNPLTLYGYIVYDSTGPTLIWATPFKTTITIQNLGDFVSIDGIIFGAFDVSLCAVIEQEQAGGIIFDNIIQRPE